MPSCKICNARQLNHNNLYEILKTRDIDMEGVVYGIINGQTHNPHREHDSICRKKDNNQVYRAPVYILDTGDALIELPDMGQFKSPAEYADAIESIIDDSMDQ